MYSGSVDYEIIKNVKKSLKIPVVANGDITDAKTATEALLKTGADGIMIEVHNNPSCALCDGAQSLTPAQFAQVSETVTKIREAIR